MGFWRPKPKSPLDKEIEGFTGGLRLVLPSAEMLRVYKVVKVNAATGRAVAIKNR